MMQALQIVAVVVGILMPTMGPVLLWMSRVNSRLTRIETMLERSNEAHHAH